jgi:basic membrane lipoprotein Med (substrate-binding protein (PBP1-ABC) superfamily)
MKKWIFPVFLLVVLAVAIMLACGSSPRILQSVSLSPATADAQGSLVQFTATGYFNDQPSTAKLVAANWGACYQNQRTTAVS